MISAHSTSAAAERKHSIDLRADDFRSPGASGQWMIAVRATSPGMPGSPSARLSQRRISIRVRPVGWRAGAIFTGQRMLREMVAQAPAQTLSLVVRSTLVSGIHAGEAGLYTSTVFLSLLIGLHSGLCHLAVDPLIRSGAVAGTAGRRRVLHVLPYALMASGAAAVAHGVDAFKGRALLCATAAGLTSSFVSGLLNQYLKRVGGQLQILTADGKAAPKELLAQAVDPGRLRANKVAYALLAVTCFLLAEALKPAKSPDLASASFSELMVAGWASAFFAWCLDVLFAGTEAATEVVGVLNARTPDAGAMGLQIVYEPQRHRQSPGFADHFDAAIGRTALRQIFRTLPDASDALASFLPSRSAPALALRSLGRALAFPMGVRSWIQQQADAAREEGTRAVTGRKATVPPVSPATRPRRSSTVFDGENIVHFYPAPAVPR